MREHSHSMAAATSPEYILRRPHSTAILEPESKPATTKFAFSLLICRPEAGGRHHRWVLQLHNQSTGDCTLFHLQGLHPKQRLVIQQCRPHYRRLRIIKSIHLAEFHLLPSGFFNLACAIEEAVPIRCEAAEWNGQDYVLDVLEMLEEDWWIDVDDSEYLLVKKKVTTMYGPVDLVQRAVMLYPKWGEGKEASGDALQQTDFDMQSIRFNGRGRDAGYR